jgi:hypothetical protein
MDAKWTLASDLERVKTGQFAYNSSQHPYPHQVSDNRKEMLVLISFSLFALAIAAFMYLIVSVAIIKAFALFLGLQGTIFLASAFSPSHDDIKLDRPQGLLNGLLWHFREGRWLNYPINYNPVFFYGGLALLALSFVLSAIPR